MQCIHATNIGCVFHFSSFHKNVSFFFSLFPLYVGSLHILLRVDEWNETNSGTKHQNKLFYKIFHFPLLTVQTSSHMPRRFVNMIAVCFAIFYQVKLEILDICIHLLLLFILYKRKKENAHIECRESRATGDTFFWNVRNVTKNCNC